MDRKQKLLNEIVYQLRNTDYVTLKAINTAVCNINAKRGIVDESKKRINRTDLKD